MELHSGCDVHASGELTCQKAWQFDPSEDSFGDDPR
jgi:hypothetical protein